MKQYTKTIQKPMLEITYECSISPREWGNLGYFITVDKDCLSPDDNSGKIYHIVKETGEIADNQQDHIKKITERIKNETLEEVLAIYPIVKYEHSGISYSIGEKHGFDHSNNGFYIITDISRKKIGVLKKNFVKTIKDELKVYNQYINGEVYSFILYDKEGNIEHSCGGFYDIRDITEHLPKEWEKEDLEKYIV